MSKDESKSTPLTEVIIMTPEGVELTPEQTAELKARLQASGLNPFERHIRLDEEFAKTLYEVLEKLHPEVFKDEIDPLRREMNAKSIMEFLRKQFEDIGIQVNEKAFGMLYLDFISSERFYFTAKRLKGN